MAEDGGVTYRRASLYDLDVLIDLRVAFIEEAWGKAAPPRLRESVRAYLARAVPGGQCVAYLAHAGGKPVGTGAVVFYEMMPNAEYPDGRHAYILNMYTRPDYRRRGIADEILKRLVAEVKAKGLGNVVLHALPLGRKIYERAGFEPEPSEMKLRF